MALVYDLQAVAGWGAPELGRLPTAEDESHEYKSSRISPGDLQRAIGYAASGFWNTGGGVFAAGVDGSGRPDGGIEDSIGRQSLRDWVDQAISAVLPHGAYRISVIHDQALGLAADRRVLVIGFAESHLAPHMAQDKRYYIRAGAHTVPAPHFVVEALLARRGVSQPLLRPMLRHKAGVGYALELGFVAVTTTPAIDVRIEVPPLPYLNEHATTSLSVGVISAQAPFFFDFHVLTMGTEALPPFDVQVAFHDLLGRRYTESFTIDVAAQLGHTLVGEPGNREVVRELDSIEKVLKGMASSLKSNEQSLKTIASKLR